MSAALALRSKALVLLHRPAAQINDQEEPKHFIAI
jgi:hypothetical protein